MNAVGVLATDGGLYLHAEDLVDYFNDKATTAREHLDFEMFEQYDNAAKEIAALIESEIQ
jgi:hypothetical protein